MNAEQFKQAMGIATDRPVSVKLGVQLGPKAESTLYVNFFNLPADVHAKKLGGGAESENNRQLFRVQFLPNGKAKVSQMINMLQASWLPNGGRADLRTKTASPEKIAAYLGAYINETAATVEPRFTHSKVSQ